ncbi:universal stress protein [Paractinoplanes deccanensis]|uniref:Universal stress protein n=1 Tax=Paractinoplanes deccanensis TaxID=113561 RepID=A0ABQ3YEK3_9ACTN|nr:universal stress protein [Actinoplanes deccanensis]GID78436.1 universal stress protein [Actinoplanes deccanensis]
MTQAHSDATRFGEAINRYLGAVGYPDPYAPAPRPAAHAAPAAPSTGLIVAGADETPAGFVAVDHAAVEAELRGWALRIVNVRRPGAGDAGARLLDRLSERVRTGSPAVAVTTRLVIGPDPARALLAEAGEAGLVVVGHRHGATATTFGRSVADRVARQHAGPVLLVRMPAGSAWPARPLIVGVDGSPPARASLEFALAEARVRGCEVVVLHVVGDGSDLARRLDTRSPVPVHHKIIQGDPLAELIEASGRAAAVVIGRHHHGVLLPGTALSAAAHLLPQRALCPVFMVGPV